MTGVITVKYPIDHIGILDKRGVATSCHNSYCKAHAHV